METQWTPPYMYQGLYDLETRKLIEAPNRATIAAMFERRQREYERKRMLAKIKAMHDKGIHMPGRCPYCPAGYYWD